MKTNELEKLLGTTKDTLRYYEKEELISPSRDDNGYRNYSYEDIRIIKNIIMLRSFDLSIEDIRRIFNNEISLNTFIFIILFSIPSPNPAIFYSPCFSDRIELITVELSRYALATCQFLCSLVLII